MEVPGQLKQQILKEKRLTARLLMAASRVEAAEQERIWALVAAHAGGLSIRQIAAVSGLSSSRVHQLLRPEKPEQILERYEQQLKLYGIYRHTWQDDKLVDNPKLKPILAALAHISRPCAERAIQAFLKWIRNKTEKQVCDTYGSKYKAMEVAVLKGWE